MKLTFFTFLHLVVSVNAFSLGPSFLSAAEKAALRETAEKIATPGKGITACDEGPATIGGRFDAVGVANSEETRRLYRQMLFTAPGCEDYLSAAILDPETLYQVSCRLFKIAILHDSNNVSKSTGCSIDRNQMMDKCSLIFLQNVASSQESNLILKFTLFQELMVIPLCKD